MVVIKENNMKWVLSVCSIFICLDFTNAQNPTLQETKLWIENYAGSLLDYSFETYHGDKQSYHVFSHSTSFSFEGEILVITAHSKDTYHNYVFTWDYDLQKSTGYYTSQGFYEKKLVSRVNPKDIYLSEFSIDRVKYEGLDLIVAVSCRKRSVVQERIVEGRTVNYSVDHLALIYTYRKDDDPWTNNFADGYKRVFNAVQALARFSGASQLPTVDPNKY